MASTSIVIAQKQRTPVQKYVMDAFVEWEISHFAQYADTDLAHVVMQAKQGNIDMIDAAKLLEALLRLRDGGVESLQLEGTSLVFMVETALAERIGAKSAAVLHVGRSRIDQTATVQRLVARPKLLSVIKAITYAQEELLAFSKRNAHVLVPYFTHLQHSQPGTFGHSMLAYLFRLQENVEACKIQFEATNKSPLGTAGRCGTSWAIDRNLTARLLGFNGTVYHSLQGRDPNWAMNIAAALSQVMFNMSDLTSEIQYLLSSPVNYLELDISHCSISSIFPHKRNPLTTDRVRTVSGGASQWFATAFTICRGNGTGDHQIRQVPELTRWLDETREMATLTGEIIRGLSVDEERLIDILADLWVGTTNLVDTLTREKKYGLTYREAHDIVVNLIALCKEQKLAPKDVNPRLVEEAAKGVVANPSDINITTEELLKALDAKTFVDECVSDGSVGPDEVAKMLGMAEQEISDNRNWVEAKETAIANAAVELNKRANDIVFETLIKSQLG